MFKKNLNWRLGFRGSSTARRLSVYRLAWTTFFLLLVAGLTACNTVKNMPPANLSEPGWTVLQGQAVWRPKLTAPEIAGDLLVATNLDGRSFIQFTKTPLPIVVGQTTSNSWKIHFVPNNQTFSAPGHPPSKIVWLHLPRDLAGAKPPKFWHFTKKESGTWHLEEHFTGESLEGYLNP
ncbi:hypothetical protein [Pedosphaera parvula]|uniref:Uncharacterized protein n=1 Tax=Pedosphaera parvula (strain Ellin514) TaxID=320771 RepID=B9XGB2_PEDPL|nr:hypothetical protein [Pedosphaera parvula]EEF61274.1 hypothetical protein Cflav_PD3991 [Pedosphaera parvula Ellin514]